MSNIDPRLLNISFPYSYLTGIAQRDDNLTKVLRKLNHDFQQLVFLLFQTSEAPEAIAKTYAQVIIALATLQSSVQDLSRAYIQHANTVLGPTRATALDANLTNILTDSGLILGRPAETTLTLEAEPEGKKKRKRTPHDPNAPKRALTPYFLYMQSARQQISRELGDNAKPKEVADEGTRRWTQMSIGERSVSCGLSVPRDPLLILNEQIWDEQYQKNLAAYRVKMAAYKAGQPVPSDEEAAALVQAGKAPEHVEGIDAQESEEEVAQESSVESTPEPIKEPSPPKSKRRKVDKAATPSKDTPKAAAKSPEKKSGKKAKKEATPPPAPASTSKAADKKKKTKKA